MASYIPIETVVVVNSSLEEIIQDMELIYEYGTQMLLYLPILNGIIFHHSSSIYFEDSLLSFIKQVYLLIMWFWYGYLVWLNRLLFFWTNLSMLSLKGIC